MRNSALPERVSEAQAPAEHLLDPHADSQRPGGSVQGLFRIPGPGDHRGLGDGPGWNQMRGRYGKEKIFDLV